MSRDRHDPRASALPGLAQRHSGPSPSGRSRILSGLRTAWMAVIRPWSTVKEKIPWCRPSKISRPGMPLTSIIRPQPASAAGARYQPTSTSAMYSAPRSGLRTAATLPPPSAVNVTSLSSTPSSAPISPDRQATANAETTFSCSSGEAGNRGVPSSTRLRAREASCRTAAGVRPTTSATSGPDIPNTSCRTKAVRSAGDSDSSTTSSAMVTRSSWEIRSAGSSQVPTAGSGSHSPTYCSRRTRAEPS